MPDRDPAAPLHAPFDQGVFLLHYNRGRESFEEGRYAEARRELENAQKLRPDDADVLNLLGLVYFKTNAFPEAEVIYRRLTRENFCCAPSSCARTTRSRISTSDCSTGSAVSSTWRSSI